jgi:hypothetical protein
MKIVNQYCSLALQLNDKHLESPTKLSNGAKHKTKEL